jgi:hypothetical protein
MLASFITGYPQVIPSPWSGQAQHSGPSRTYGLQCSISPRIRRPNLLHSFSFSFSLVGGTDPPFPLTRLATCTAPATRLIPATASFMPFSRFSSVSQFSTRPCSPTVTCCPVTTVCDCWPSACSTTATESAVSVYLRGLVAAMESSQCHFGFPFLHSYVSRYRWGGQNDGSLGVAAVQCTYCRRSSDGGAGSPTYVTVYSVSELTPKWRFFFLVKVPTRPCLEASSRNSCSCCARTGRGAKVSLLMQCTSRWSHAKAALVRGSPTALDCLSFLPHIIGLRVSDQPGTPYFLMSQRWPGM